MRPEKLGALVFIAFPVQQLDLHAPICLQMLFLQSHIYGARLKSKDRHITVRV